MTDSSGNTVWTKITVDCLFERVNQVSDLLEEFGAQSVSILPSGRDRTETIALFEQDSNTVSSACAEIERVNQDDPEFRITESSLANRDWVGESQRNLQPVQINNAFQIVPPWHEAEEGKTTVVINPGTAFGTGHHETTTLCLKFLYRLNLKGCTVVDYGCGSGVLAISALLLGAKIAWGVDIDPDALHESRNNATRNNVLKKYHSCLPGDIPDDLQADVVLANLYAGALEDLCFELVQLTRPGGHLALSGIVYSQVNRVHRWYSNQINFSIERMGDWVLLAGQRFD